MTWASAFALVLAMASPAAAAGSGSGGGGSGGGGVDTTGSIYSDLVIALRDASGAPILKMYDVPATETEPATTEYCVQPASYEPIPGITSLPNPVDGRQVWVVPLQGEWLDDANPPIPVEDIGACDPQPQYSMFVREVDLERLNLTRTSDEVIAGKLADVQTKLQFANLIALESTGRIAFDDTPIDAAPENAAIYQNLMKSGTIPGLHPAAVAGPPALIGPAPKDGVSNSQFGAWELAAMAIGAAASKSTPINVDTVEYYNRIIGLADFTSLWSQVNFVQPADPANPGSALTGSEKFVDFSGFTYNRSETFKGSVTWLDVPSLKWQVSHITDVVPFTNLTNQQEIGTTTLHGVTAFAQLADDVRALCNFIPDNTFIPGFYMDVPGVDTYDAQLKAIHDPAVDLGTLPTTVFKTHAFQLTAPRLNPWRGTLICDARLRLTIRAPAGLAQGDVTATAADGQTVPFTVGADGSLVGWWGPDSGFPVAPGYNVSTTFEVTVADSAPSGAYDLALDLVKVSDPSTVLAQDIGTLAVNDNTATVAWGDSIAKYATQGSAVKIPVRLYSPVAGTGHLTLTVGAPEALAAGDVKVYGSNGTDMVAMPLSLSSGALAGTWDAALSAGYTDVAWYVTVAEGAPVGNYSFTVSLEGGNTLDPVLVAISAPETHGEQPPGAGEDTTPPVVSLTSWTILGTSATFAFLADDEGTTFECQLEKDGTVQQAWASCASPKAYTGLAAGSYTFSVRGTNRGALISTVVTHSWTVDAPPPVDTTPPVVGIVPIGTPGSTATFELTSNEPGTTFACQLTKNHGRPGAWAPCTSPVTFSNLQPATYTLSLRGTDTAGNLSDAKSSTWTVKKGGSSTGGASKVVTE
jgi:hypothetical protein